MSNHMTRTWDHKGSKPLGPKLLSLGHHLDSFIFFILFFSPLDFYYLIPKQLHFILISYLFIFLHFNRLFYFTLYFNFEFFIFFHINDINFNLIKEIIKNPKKSMTYIENMFFLKKKLFKKKLKKERVEIRIQHSNLIIIIIITTDTLWRQPRS